MEFKFFQENIEKSATEYFQVLYRNVKMVEVSWKKNKSFCPYDTQASTYTIISF